MRDEWSFEPAQAKLAGWMAPFSGAFTAPTWQRVLVLLIGAILSPGRRTVAAALRVTGLDQDPHFTNYHRFLTRLRLDARLFDPPARRRPGTIGRPRVIGARQANLADRLTNPKTRWQRVKVTGWYGRGERTVEIISGTALWHPPGRLVPIRYVLVRDVAGELRSQAFLCTDLKANPVDILRWFVRRWSIEATFAEVRRHLGVETQRQWSDPAIARTTPALLGLFSLVALWAHELYPSQSMASRAAAWYPKPLPTFSDALALVRCELWTRPGFDISANGPRLVEIPRTTINALIGAACYAA